MGGKVRFSIGFDLSTGISVSVVLTPIGYGERQRAAIQRSTKSRSGFVVQPVSAKAKSSLAQAGSHATLVSSAPRTTRAPGGQALSGFCSGSVDSESHPATWCRAPAEPSHWDGTASACAASYICLEGGDLVTCAVQSRTTVTLGLSLPAD